MMNIGEDNMLLTKKPLIYHILKKYMINFKNYRSGEIKQKQNEKLNLIGKQENQKLNLKEIFKKKNSKLDKKRIA